MARVTFVTGTLALALAIAPAESRAHFVFILPDTTDATIVRVVLSDTLQPHATVPVSRMGKLQLYAPGSDGSPAALYWEEVDNFYRVKLPAGEPWLVFGHTVYGVMKHGDEDPFLLHYHPKTLLRDPFASDARIGSHSRMEIVPQGKPGRARFLVLVEGKPLADAEVFLLAPGMDKMEMVRTDSRGTTPECKAIGRYGVVARWLIQTPGTWEGKPYREIRHYATLVVDIGNPEAGD